MNNQEIKELALANGLKLKEQPDGSVDLNPYVYDFSRAISLAANSQLAAKIDVLRQALDDVYAEAQKHTGEYAAVNARIANQALLKTEAQCLKYIKSEGFFEYLKMLPDSNRMVPISHIKDYLAQHARNLLAESRTA